MIKFYNLYLDELNKVKDLEKKPKLLLHTCCAPCSSHTLKELVNYFDITVCYYNPNIYPESEYDKRLAEQIRFIKDFGLDILVLDKEYDPKSFFEAVKGLEHLGERSIRCDSCFRLRLEYTAKKAKELGFDYFTTSLTISPLKNSDSINLIMEDLANKYQINCLYSDFKKANGYQDSIKLSKEYDLYRQDYCGCIFSKKEREEYQKKKEELNNVNV